MIQKQEGLPDLLVSLARSHEENDARAASTRKLMTLALMATLAAALVAAALLWLNRRDAATAAGEHKVVRLDRKPPTKVTSAELPPPREIAAGVAQSDPVAVAPPKALGAPGSVIQLGAYENQAQAERAWAILSARFPSVATMGRLMLPFPGGIRLRAAAASPREAKQVCKMLKAAGENCFVAQ